MIDHPKKEIELPYHLVLSPLYDVYLLARLFRSYDPAEPARNIIIYNGARHSIHISEFFTSLSAKVSPTINNNNNTTTTITLTTTNKTDNNNNNNNNYYYYY
jgi:hypothetical protein